MTVQIDDAELRRSAFEWLSARTNDGAEPVSREALRQDFQFNGVRFPMIDAQRGIRKPAGMTVAFSILTTYAPEGSLRPYEDGAGPDGLIRYKWQGSDGQHHENVGLRNAMNRLVPIIWFVGVGDGLFWPVYPVYVVGEEVNAKQFILAPDSVAGLARGEILSSSPVEANLKRYVDAEVKRRLHQPVFRATVMRAYETRCAVCSLRHGELLDAAHIVPDSDDRGVATVNNGLALCKIHHAAFDVGILGIRPRDLRVEIRGDVLDEIDGPMLQHGLKDRHGQRLMVLPKKRGDAPDDSLLTIAYDKFKSRRAG